MSRMVTSAKQIQNRNRQVDNDLGPREDQLHDCLKPGEIAFIFKVDVKTISRWAHDKRFPDGAIFRTLGGHRRFHAWAILQVLRQDGYLNPEATLKHARAAYADKIEKMLKVRYAQRHGGAPRTPRQRSTEVPQQLLDDARPRPYNEA